MRVLRLLTTFIIITAIGILYDKYKEKYDPEPEKVQFNLIHKYLLNSGDNNKPIMWVFNDYKTNSRHWKTFGSRNTKDMNQPYIHMCIETIIKWCGDSFNICLINYESFDKLLKDWTIDVDKLTSPIKERVISLGLFRILNKYGGVLIPNSMVMMTDFKDYHNEYLGTQGCYVGEFVCRNINSDIIETFPNMKLFGCKKQNKIVRELCNYLEMLISTDNTNESDFMGNLDRMLYKFVDNGNLNKISGNLLGTRDINKESITIDHLLNNSNIAFDLDLVSVYIPKDEILKRSKYSWFSRSNKVQVLSSNTNIAKMFLLSYN
jgi:hypothetical protein